MKFNVIRFELYVTPFSRHITTKFPCPQGELIAVSVGRTRTLESSNRYWPFASKSALTLLLVKILFLSEWSQLQLLHSVPLEMMALFCSCTIQNCNDFLVYNIAIAKQSTSCDHCMCKL